MCIFSLSPGWKQWNGREKIWCSTVRPLPTVSKPTASSRLHRPRRREAPYRPAPRGDRPLGGPVRSHPQGGDRRQRPCLSGAGTHPQAGGAFDLWRHRLRVARAAGGTGVRRIGGKRLSFRHDRRFRKVSLTFVPFARRRYEILTVDVTDQDPAPPSRRRCPPTRHRTCTVFCSPERPVRAASIRML